MQIVDSWQTDSMVQTCTKLVCVHEKILVEKFWCFVYNLLINIVDENNNVHIRLVKQVCNMIRERPQQIWIIVCWFSWKKCMNYDYIINIYVKYNLSKSRSEFCCLNLLMLAICLHFLHLFYKKHRILIQICCSVPHIMLQTCFSIKDSNQNSFFHYLTMGCGS